MKVLVTGGAGFIGSHLVDKLIKQGHKVLVFDDLSTGKKVNLNKRAQFIKMDIRSPKLSPALKKFGPEVVYHLAAQVSVPASIKDPMADAEINVIGSLNVIKASIDNFVKKFIFISSGGAIYGDADLLPTPESATTLPLSPYGQAKLTIENYLRSFDVTTKLSFVCLRLANVYGPRQLSAKESGVVTIFINKLLAGEQLPLHGRGEQTRDFIFVDDVVSAAITLKDKGTGVYNVGTGRQTSVRELAIVLGEVAGVVPLVSYEPPRGSGEVMHSCLDNRRLRSDTGWKPVFDLKAGLEETINWFKGL